MIAQWPIILNLLAGSLLGAWVGASWAARMRGRTLYQVLAVLLVLIAIVLMLGHDRATQDPILTGTAQLVAGVMAGFGIGVVASIMGVAGGELLIPTLVLLFGVDIAGRIAVTGRESAHHDRRLRPLQPGSVLRHPAYPQVLRRRDGRRFHRRCSYRRPVARVIPSNVLLPVLAAILLISSVKVWRHK